MRLREIRRLHFRLPLRRSWLSAAGQLAQRSGWLVALDMDDGRTGWGECASESGAELVPCECAEAWLGLSPEAALERLPRERGMPPEERCALETALLDALAMRDGVPLARWLDAAAATTVRVNAALGDLDETVRARAAQALAEGYAVLKLKLGVHPWHEERARLHGLARALPPGVMLRLDANRAWDVEVARAVLAELRDLPVESLEEPLREPDLPTLARLQAGVPFALALDESLDERMLDRVLAHPAVRRLVLKPMRMGGPGRVVEIARRAHAAGLQCVVTTTVDSAVGTLAAAHAAAALDNGLAHGLATSSWLARDVAEPPRIVSGTMALSGPGLGLGDVRVSPSDSATMAQD
jgi:o-succinylbenzoate synthase